jgi:uronate dehydrogenase
MAMRTVLITGAAGGIGRGLRTLLSGVYGELRLTDVVEPADLRPGEHFTRADVGDAEAIARLLEGVDGVIHLGAISGEGHWPAILRTNIEGTYNVFEGARRAGVQRVVFASSNHAVGFYPRRRRIGVDAAVRPDSRYGISKAFGEAVGAYYADKFGLRVLAIRIGNFGERPIDLRRLSIWIHPEDLAQLVRIGLEHPALHYAVVFGASDNARSFWDNEPAFRLGYRPRHRSEDHRDAALAAQAALPPDPIGDRFEGGTFCSDEYAGDPDRSGS